MPYIYIELIDQEVLCPRHCFTLEQAFLFLIGLCLVGYGVLSMIGSTIQRRASKLGDLWALDLGVHWRAVHLAAARA